MMLIVLLINFYLNKKINPWGNKVDMAREGKIIIKLLQIVISFR
jgi:hypothetical protein